MKQRFYHRWPLWLQITSAFIFFLTLVVVATGEYVRQNEYSFLYAEMEENKKRLIDIIATSAVESIITEDIAVLNTIVKNLTSTNADIETLIIENEEQKSLVSWYAKDFAENDYLLIHSEPIILEGETFGYIQISWNLKRKLNEIDGHVLKTYLFNSLSLLIFTIISLLGINWLISRPIKDIERRLLGHSKGLILTGEKIKRSREISNLYSAVENIQRLTTSRDELEKEVSRRKKAQEELAIAHDKAMAATEAKSIFLANMSHEIRTPLTAIVGFSESLLDTDQTMSERVESIQTIIRSGKHLQTLINDILDMSKIEAGKLEIECHEKDLFEIIHDVEALARLQAETKGLEFDLDLHFPLPEKIITDPLRLKQILINLVGNAIKFTDSGGVKIETKYLQTDNKLEFSVIDTGIGMNDEQMQNIFAAFTQADSSTTRTYGGTGLGLHLSQQLAHRLQGEIHVASKLSKGSRFTLSVDAGQAARGNMLSAAPERQIIATEQIEELSGHILLAEDNHDNQRLISLLIRKLGVDVTIANNGEEAVEYAMKQNYDLLLMDMQMPVMNGVDATRNLRKQGYTGTIAALTANATTGDRDFCLANGFNDFLSKPINRLEFNAFIRKHLQHDKDNATTIDNSPIHSSKLDDPIIAELLPEYLKRLPEMIADIQKYYNSGQLEELRMTAHNLKSTSGSYGFMQLYEQAAKLEFEIVKQDKSGILSRIDKIFSLKDRILNQDST